jgi:glycosyltransferase involved in cell wall biosynthesis
MSPTTAAAARVAPPEVLDPATDLRVLHVGKYYPPVPGGMERVLQLLCEYERCQVDSRVLVASTGRRTRRESWRGVPVVRAASLATVGSVGLSPALAWHLARTPADVTVIHEPNPVALLADAVTLRRGPLLVYYHSEVVRSRWKYRLAYRPLLARVLDRADRIIVASPAMADTAEQLTGYRHKCVVIPYGIDPRTLAVTPAISGRVVALRRHRTAPLLLFVGRLVGYKGADVLIRAMRDVDAELVIVGDGPLGPSLRQLARDMNVDARVRFAGSVADHELAALYHACDVFVLPSVTRAEAFGMVQIEAMACGKPVVSTALPSGVPWVNRHGETGLVVPPGSAEALGAAIRSLLDDDALRMRLGQAARIRVAREFNAARMAERTVALYHHVLRTGRA